MKLEVGMYIWTKYCGICDEIAIRKIIKIDKINNNWFYIDKNVCDIYKDYTNKINTVNVEKASFNIIDILEIGDIISFYEDIDNYKKQYVIGISDLITLDEIKDKITNDNIRLVSILTKEQFEQREYKIGE